MIAPGRSEFHKEITLRSSRVWNPMKHPEGTALSVGVLLLLTAFALFIAALVSSFVFCYYDLISETGNLLRKESRVLFISWFRGWESQEQTTIGTRLGFRCIITWHTGSCMPQSTHVSSLHHLIKTPAQSCCHLDDHIQSQLHPKSSTPSSTNILILVLSPQHKEIRDPLKP